MTNATRHGRDIRLHKFHLTLQLFI